MTAWKAAFWGGAAGMVASLIGAYSVTGFLFRALPAAIPFVLFCVGAGSVLGSGVIRLAKSAKRRELEEAHELHGLPLNNPLDPFA
jgi:hypothetical protein